MKSFSFKIILPLVLALFIIACSTKRDTLLNRKYHALTTEYNVLFNGQEAFSEYYLQLTSTYKDDYWAVLPVEPFAIKTFVDNPNEESIGDVSVAEEKATKAIQKHSMNSSGQEKNTQIDEAYLLLGKTRYYDNRFLPALEAFNYAIYKSPEANTTNETIIWRERVHIKLENNEEAISNLKELLAAPKDKYFKNELVADAHAVLAQAYYNIKVVDTAVINLTTARKLTKNNEKRARFTFILGQLHQELNQPDSAFYYFQDVIDMKRKAKRIYTMQSYAQQASMFDYENGDTVAFLKTFDKLLKNYENRPYRYILEYRLGNFYKNFNNYNRAKEYYNFSIKNNNSQDQYLQASNYKSLGQIFFDERSFKTSAKYYDSCLVNLNSKTKEYITVKRKIANIDELIKYEDIVHHADSTIRIYEMSDSERVTYFTNHIDSLKIEDTKKALLAKELAQKQANIAMAQTQQEVASAAFSNFEQPQSQMPMPPSSDLGSPTFYYYIPASVEQGKLNFERRWGKRPLKDNWRWAAMRTGSRADKDLALTAETTEAEQADEEFLIDLNAPKYNLETYLSQVITDPNEIKELQKNRNAAFYELGFIYDEKFGEYQLAADRLERLYQSDPEEKLVLPTLYNLHKIYIKLNNPKADGFKDIILTQYPETHYAKVLQGIAVDRSGSPEAVYATVYKAYLETNDPEVALQQVNEKIDFYTGTPIVTKFELLKARILAKSYGVGAYKQALTQLETAYPLSEEGKEAKRILTDEIPELENNTFTDKDANKWLLVYEMPKDKVQDVTHVVVTINKYIKDSKIANLKVSVDYYNPEKTLVCVHGFYSSATARLIALNLEEKKYKVKAKGITISLHNYVVIQTHKNLDLYTLNK